MRYPSVVRVFATSQDPDYDSPWQSPLPSSSTGSGVVIGPNQILTGAHVVANATFLQVQKVANPDKVVARIAAISHDCDLALLEVDVEGFMDGIEPVGLGELPELRDRVSVVGYPVGGEEISVTEGVVSRVEIQNYSHSQRSLLAVTIDAAINDGNSGGPVYAGGKVIGIAFQSLSDAENIGSVVPTPLIRRFLTGIEKRTSLAVPSLGLLVQNLENPLLRTHMGLKADESGVRIAAVEYGGSAWGVLRVGDVLQEVAELSVSNNGTVSYAGRYRTQWTVALTERFVGESLPVRVVRDGERLDLEVTLEARKRLVPFNEYVRVPTYFVYGGLVFQRLNRNFLKTWRRWWDKAPKEFLHYYYAGHRTEERQEVVILTKVLADEINQGYGGLHTESVLSVNGAAPRDMAEFVRFMEAAEGLLELRTSRCGVIVLDVAAAKKANEEILERYRIPRDRSPDLDA
jgi:S1-C subfamily serine protease